MGESMTVNVTRRGGVTIPKALREKYNLKNGDVLSVIDLDGAFVVKPGHLQTDRLANQIRDRLRDEGETLESVLKTLKEDRSKESE